MIMKTPFVSNIQRFSTKDGPGIRTTVFFKGCPLSCIWCHNPETQSPKPQLMISDENCVRCGRCVYECPNGAVKESDGRIITDRDKCTVCQRCTDVCFYNARALSGKPYTQEEIAEVILRDKPFYIESGGGATFSGGECMLYPEFLEKILYILQEERVHIAIDTSGFAPFESFLKVLPYTDLFLYDIKAFSPKLHEEFTGVPNELIWDNLFRLCEKGARVNLRLPLIEGCNADIDEVEHIADRTAKLDLAGVNLLPYHDMGKYKYIKLGRAYDDFMSAPAPEKLEHFVKIFKSKGFKNVKIGG